MSDPARPIDPRLSRDDLRLVQDLQRQSVEEIRHLRAHARVELELGVVLHPANASDADRPRIRAVTRDVSRGGCGLLLERPPLVGDVYRIEFERGEVELPVVFARCIRCAMVREGAFEAGFSFFQDIEIEERAASSSADDDLLA